MEETLEQTEKESINKIQLKGTKEGLLIVFPENENWNELLKQLNLILDKDRTFWAGAATSVDVSDYKLEESQLNRFCEMLVKRYHLVVNTIYSQNEETREIVKALNLKTGISYQYVEKALPPTEIVQSSTALGNAMYIKQTVRSGQTVRFDGNIVIYGDTNPGSEIIASGDIVVLGTLRGVAHAGAKGDETCQIIATNLKPTQLRIASCIGVSDNSSGQAANGTEYACISDGKIYIGAFKAKR